MADTAVNEVDPQVLEDLRIVEQTCQLFGACGTRAEFWEAFTLLKVGRTAFQAEADRITGIRGKGGQTKVDPSVIEKLTTIKKQIAPLARQLREFLGKGPTQILDGMKQDLALVFLMGSAKARKAVERWVSDPSGSAAESGLRLKILSRLVDSYRRGLLEARRQGAPASPSLDTTVRSMAPTTVKLKPEFVDDLRRAEVARGLLKGVEPRPGWDLLLLLLTQRDETRRQIDEMEQLQTTGKPGEFAGSSYRLRTLMKHMRTQHDSLVTPLRAYLNSLYGTFAGDVDELSLAFLVASPQGCHRARQWLDDPDLCRGEATASMNGLRSRSTSYYDAMKSMPAPAKP